MLLRAYHVGHTILPPVCVCVSVRPSVSLCVVRKHSARGQICCQPPLETVCDQDAEFLLQHHTTTAHCTVHSNLSTGAHHSRTLSYSRITPPPPPPAGAQFVRDSLTDDWQQLRQLQSAATALMPSEFSIKTRVALNIAQRTAKDFAPCAADPLFYSLNNILSLSLPLHIIMVVFHLLLMLLFLLTLLLPSLLLSLLI